MKPLRESYVLRGATWVRVLYVFGLMMVLIAALWLALFNDINQRRESVKDRSFARLTAYAGMVAWHFDTSVLAVDITLSYLRRAWQHDSASFPQQIAAILGPLAGYTSAHVCILGSDGHVKYEGHTEASAARISCAQQAELSGGAQGENWSFSAREDPLLLSPIVLKTDAVDTIIAFGRRVNPELAEASDVMVLLISGNDLANRLESHDIPHGVSYGALTRDNGLLWLGSRNGKSDLGQYIPRFDEFAQKRQSFQLKDNEIRPFTSFLTGEEMFLAVKAVEKYGIWAVASLSSGAVFDGVDALWGRYKVFGGLFTIVLMLWGAVIFLYLQRRVESEVRMQQDYQLLQTREMELEESRRLLKSLMSREINSRDAEESRIAREIHDDLGQRLVVLRMDVAQLLRKGAVTTDPGLSKRLTALLEQINEIIAAMRNIVHSILPTSFDLGLAAALQTLVDDFTAKSGVVVTLMSDLPESAPIDERLSFTVYRIVQEALTNIATHSGATHGLVALDLQDGDLSLIIKDNGRGFAKTGHMPGFGLKSMKERALMMEGSLDVESSDESGVSIQVRFPLREQWQGH